jgi:hypothetical protein
MEVTMDTGWVTYEELAMDLAEELFVGIDPGGNYAFSVWGKYDIDYFLCGVAFDRMEGIINPYRPESSNIHPGKLLLSILDNPKVSMVMVEDQFKGPLTKQSKLNKLQMRAAATNGAVVQRGIPLIRIEPMIWRNTIDWVEGDTQLLDRIPYLHQNEWKAIALPNARKHLIDKQVVIKSTYNDAAEAILIGKALVQIDATGHLTILYGPYHGNTLPVHINEKKKVKIITKETVWDEIMRNKGADRIPY